MLALAPRVALAQRTTENATLQSGDAFGRTVGSEKTGLYTSDDVRGFNPVDAGNARIEGLYFDQLDRLPSRTSDGSTVRVGLSALGYPFPAPTGLIDSNLTKPDGSASASIALESGSTFANGFGGSAEFKLPLSSDDLGISGGVGWRDAHRYEGGKTFYLSVGAAVAWKPYAGAEVLAFAGGFLTRSDEARATLFPAGSTLPPRQPRGEFLGQYWTGRDTDTSIVGSIARLPLGQWRLEAGLFRMRKHNKTAFADLVLGVAADGSSANREVIAYAGTEDKSLSGEVRLVRQWRSGALAQQVTASLRGRRKDRLFGGGQAIFLGPSSALQPDFRPQPAIAPGPTNQDHVRQLTGGIAWNLKWGTLLTLDAGLSKSTYRKEIVFADPLLGNPVTRDHPLLWNVAGSLSPADWLTFYVGYSRGQEEALIAPDLAVNRAEAPPAIRTKQVEAGVRLRLGEGLTLVAGGFAIRKPYYNLDPALVYRQLGALRNRGIELSLTGHVAPGLTVVAGTMLLEPQIRGEAVTNGLIGPRPVGQIRRRSVVNVDWREDGGKGALSFDLGVESFSSRMGNAANTLSAPAYSTVNLGARYRFQAGKAKMLLRPQLLNVANSYGWLVNTSGGFTYTAPRTLLMSLITDL